MTLMAASDRMQPLEKLIGVAEPDVLALMAVSGLMRYLQLG